ncbi:MAG: hemerythrin domain-containing protein [Kiritimatiellae bacterium]|jgi:hemerythrin-like domain-containing protein|nr:hemerythrin domain-containing protein [Kiritimatiellia bacterium]
MDKLTKILQDHRELGQSIEFFGKFLDAFIKKEMPDYLKRFQRFHAHMLAHFRLEEEGIFSFALQNGGPQEKQLARELQEDHRRILDMLAKFDNLLVSYNNQSEAKHTMDIVDIDKELFKAIYIHAQKEELQLFPALKKYAG